MSLDGGTRWVALKGNMPTVPVTDLVIHPRELDLIVATYGRGLYVANTRWLAEAKKGALDEDVHFFAVAPRPVPRRGRDRRTTNCTATATSSSRTTRG